MVDCNANVVHNRPMKAKRDAQITVRIDKQMQASIEHACEEYGLSPSDLIRDAIYKYTKNRETFLRFELYGVMVDFLAEHAPEGDKTKFTEKFLAQFTHMDETEAFLNLPKQVREASLRQQWEDHISVSTTQRKFEDLGTKALSDLEKKKAGKRR